MAKADADDGKTDVPAAPPPAKKGGSFLPMLIAVVLSVGASAGVTWFLLQHTVAELKAASEPVDAEAQAAAAAEAPKAPPVYLPLDPAFVVNLEDPAGLRFLQMQMEVMGRDAKLLEDSKQHMPRIRNALLMLLGQQKIDELATREGKEKLQAAVLAEIQKILTEETGKPVVEAVYFTSFVMQ